MRGLSRLLVGVLAAIGLLYVLATLTPIDQWWIHRLAGTQYDPAGEVLVVPGADTMADVIGLSSYYRSVYAVRAWREGKFHEIVVSGGSGPAQVPIAVQMRDFMVSQGVPASAIHVETESSSTRENALKSKPILDQLKGKKILLTSDYHMFRAYRVFRKAGVDVQAMPIPDAAKQIGVWTNRWTVFVNLCVESAKIAYYFVRGWI